jgi:hypothetical protein
MHRSSESIAALAAALAKAQMALTNPEKSLTGTLPGAPPDEPGRTFRYASLSSGLDIVRKVLGQHEIATLQTTMIDQDIQTVSLTTAVQPGTWVTLLTDDVGNTFLVSFRSALVVVVVVALPVDPVGNAFLRCPQVHRFCAGAWVCADGRRHGR